MDASASPEASAEASVTPEVSATPEATQDTAALIQDIVKSCDAAARAAAGAQGGSGRGKLLAAIAQSQLGRGSGLIEGLGRFNVYNYVINGNSVSAAIDTDWSASFVAYCLRHADISLIERTADINSMLAGTQASGRYYAGNYLPSVGDVVFLRRGGRVDAICIVTSVSGSGFTAVGRAGDDNSVAAHSYDAGSDAIIGFVNIDGTAAAPEASASPEASPEAEPSVSPEASPEAEPSVSPEVSPEASPEVSPEATPRHIRLRRGSAALAR